MSADARINDDLPVMEILVSEAVLMIAEPRNALLVTETLVKGEDPTIVVVSPILTDKRTQFRSQIM